MKLGPAQVDRFLRQPDPRARLVLVYGPDEGLARERVEQLVATVLDDPSDPFRLSELAPEVLRSEPGRLGDEARSLTLTGGRRVIRVRHASDHVAAACRGLLGSGPADALVLIEAGELSPASSLRRLVEGAPDAVAIACYPDHGRDLAGLIERSLAEHGLRAAPEARDYLMEHLGADRGVSRSELAKLALYKGSDGKTGRISLDDVAAVVGDSAALGLDDLVDAAALGNAAELGRCLDRLLGEGQAPVRIVRALANHIVRLHRLRLQTERGEPPHKVIDQARPPIHFRRKERVKAALGRWSAGSAAAALAPLLRAELACKTTGWPADLVCRQAALEICRAATGGR